MVTIQEAKAKVLEVAANDSEFKNLLLKDPAEAVNRLFKIEIPEGVSLVVHQDSPNELHIVLPSEQTSELSEAELEAVAGGNCYENEPSGPGMCAAHSQWH